MDTTAQLLVESLAGMDLDGFLNIMKMVLGHRGDFVQPLTRLLVPNIIYPPSSVLEDRRCVGIVKNFFPDKKFGFISCPTIMEEFQKDACIVLASQLRGIPVGTRVNFAVALEKDGRPQAYDLHEIQSPCKFFASGACHDGASCRFSHDVTQCAQLLGQVGQDPSSFMLAQSSVGGGGAGRPPCKFFASSGQCKKGAGCNFSHDMAPGGSAGLNMHMPGVHSAGLAALGQQQALGQKRSFTQGPGMSPGVNIEGLVNFPG